MSKIIVKDRNGKRNEISANIGMTLMEIIRDAGMDIEAACGGCCACATCHIYVDKKWITNLSKKEDDEESMLDQVFEVQENSRLGCQIEFTEEIDGIEVELAPE
tara:strand:- start:3979 stop:4290 length:312 start_codon:yes stop_codon:yes gene_type:complete